MIMAMMILYSRIEMCRYDYENTDSVLPSSNPI